VPRVDYEKLSGDWVGETSGAIRARVQAGREEIRPVHLAEALQYRPKLMVSYILIHLIR